MIWDGMGADKTDVAGIKHQIPVFGADSHQHQRAFLLTHSPPRALGGMATPDILTPESGEAYGNITIKTDEEF